MSQNKNNGDVKKMEELFTGKNRNGKNGNKGSKRKTNGIRSDHRIIQKKMNGCLRI